MATKAIHHKERVCFSHWRDGVLVTRLKASAALVAVVLVVAVSGVAPVAQAQAPGSDATEPGSAVWKQVSAGEGHTCGIIRTSGRLYCWGSDTQGQLGDDATIANQPTPVEVAGGATTWASVTAGSGHTCARRTTGRLYCWGSDYYGQLGDDATIADQSTPVEVSGGATNWASVTAGNSHTCARRTTGRLYCWGDDSKGQLGNNAIDDVQPTPVQVAGGATNWATVTAGGLHTCARRTTGRLYCWGFDGYGELGNNAIDDVQPTPVQVAGGATNWATVTAGSVHTCARRTTGRLYCWGLDADGQLGNNATLADRPTPVQVAGGATTWASVTAGDGHTCARRTTGRLYCWGDDSNGQLGNSLTLADRPTPVQVAGGATNWATVDAGGAHTCARRTTGRLYCWGLDVYGELGDDAILANQPTPVEVDP